MRIGTFFLASTLAKDVFGHCWGLSFELEIRLSEFMMSWCREEDGQVDVLDSSEEDWMEPGYDSVLKGVFVNGRYVGDQESLSRL